MPHTKLDIIKDTFSGSNEVATKAILYLTEILDTEKFKSTNELLNKITREGKEIIKSQPNLISVRKRVSSATYYLKRLMRSDKSLNEIIELSIQKFKEINKTSEQKQDKLAALGAKLIYNANKILTISSSSTILKILQAAHKLNRKFEVVAVESRPKLEGQLFAEQLASNGITVSVISDSAIGKYIPDMNLVLLGADRLMENDFINKIGSLPICIVARNFKVPVYLAAETEKILPEADRAVRFYPQNSKELYIPKIKKIKVENYYFESIPYHYISKILCEEGIYETNEFINWHLKD